ncbi:MAG TPA: GNAT family protein [Thermoleophilaceae bacterium]|nr:GNAT family protein [Thermoleophilaceae bacterium]
MSELRGERVVLRPTGPADADPLRAIRLAPEVMARWGTVEDDFPLGDEPEATRYTIYVEDEPAGMIQYAEENEPDYRHAEIDIFLDPRFHNRGLGPDAMKALIRHLMGERGHHRVILSVDVDNAQGIRAYEKTGFRRVGRMRLAGRVPGTAEWRDEYLMELVREPRTAGLDE